MLKTDFSGIEKLRQSMKKIEGPHTVSFDELFRDDFMAKHTNFTTLGEMLTSSGFSVETTADFEAIPSDQWDRFVASTTRFSTWAEMMDHATQQWVKRQLGFG